LLRGDLSLIEAMKFTLQVSRANAFPILSLRKRRNPKCPHPYHQSKCAQFIELQSVNHLVLALKCLSMSNELSMEWHFIGTHFWVNPIASNKQINNII